MFEEIRNVRREIRMTTIKAARLQIKKVNVVNDTLLTFSEPSKLMLIYGDNELLKRYHVLELHSNSTDK